MATLEALSQRSRNAIQAIVDRPPPEPSESDDEQAQGKVYAAFVEKESFMELTGFTRDYINHLVHIMAPFALNARKRGPQPKSSLADALLCYLVLLRVPSDAPVLAKTLGLKEEQFNGNVARVREILNSALQSKWPDLAPRPLDDDQRRIEASGLLVDTITIECFKPKGSLWGIETLL